MGPVAQLVFKTSAVVQPTARSVRLRRRSVQPPATHSSARRPRCERSVSSRSARRVPSQTSASSRVPTSTVAVSLTSAFQCASSRHGPSSSRSNPGQVPRARDERRSLYRRAAEELEGAACRAALELRVEVNAAAPAVPEPRRHLLPDLGLRPGDEGHRLVRLVRRVRRVRVGQAPDRVSRDRQLVA